MDGFSRTGAAAACVSGDSDGLSGGVRAPRPPPVAMVIAMDGWIWGGEGDSDGWINVLIAHPCHPDAAVQLLHRQRLDQPGRGFDTPSCCSCVIDR